MSKLAHSSPFMDAIEQQGDDGPDEGNVARHDYRRPRGECAYCDEYGGEAMMPSHTPSPRCESGKRPHCTCDICF